MGQLILELNTDDQTKELLEGRRRYREQLATSYAAGEINATKKLNSVIEEKDATIAGQAATIADQTTTIAGQAATIDELQARIKELEAKNNNTNS